MYASRSTKGFYGEEKNDFMPDDAFEISYELYRALIEGEASGKLIDWTGADLPFLMDPPPLTDDESNALIDVKREAAYRAEADPIYFQVQRGDCENQVWLDKIAEIKLRFPKP